MREMQAVVDVVDSPELCVVLLLNQSGTPYIEGRTRVHLGDRIAHMKFELLILNCTMFY